MRWTLRTKWTLAVLAVGILPLGGLASLFLELQRSGLARAEKELEAAVVDEAATLLEHDLEGVARTGADVQSALADETQAPDARIAAARKLLASTSAVLGVAIFDREHRFIDAIVKPGLEADQLRVPLAAADGAGFSVLPDGRVRWEGRLGDARLSLAIAPALLEERLHDLSLTRFAAPGRVYLVDSERKAIAGRPRNEPLPIFQQPMPTSFTSKLVLTTELVDRGVPKVATLRTMPEMPGGWALVVERPTAEAFAALERTKRLLSIALGAYAVFAAVLGFLVARRALRPFTPLMALVERYSRREFGARSEVRSGDELEALGSSLEKMADDLAASETEIEKRARTETNLRRYLPAEAADAADAGALDLGGAKRSVTVVFADVVAFTGFAERTAPEKAVAFLNELFTILSEVVFRHDGMVDKFIGDCIMAVFRDDEHCARGLAAAEDMHSFVASNLPRWRSEYDFDVELGIGVATGDVLLGNLGSESRMEYTVIGDAVNVAARLEAIARPRQTLTTREVKDACPASRFTSLGEHSLRGKAQSVEVFEVVT